MSTSVLEKNPEDMTDPELVGSWLGVAIFKVVVARKLRRAVKDQNVAKTIYCVYLMTHDPDANRRYIAVSRELGKRYGLKLQKKIEAYQNK